MTKISINAEGGSKFTLISNAFIDNYMPSANGAYVKVYLHLLRCFSGNFPEISISSIADRLDHTEKDIIRALHYWEKLSLITLKENAKKEITEIQLIDISTIEESHAQEDNGYCPNSQLDEVAVSIHPSEKPARRQSYSPKEIETMTSNEEIKWAMHIIEIYLNRPLKPMDIQLILYLYEQLHFSAELIMYLYEYCLSKGKKNTSYIEAVALTWAEEGIDTEEKAKKATAAYNDHFNAVNKAFGLNRSPGQIERQYIKKWTEVFNFDDDILIEACNRTLLRTQKPDFKYANKILENWFKNGIKSKDDIAKLDEEFNKKNQTYSNKVSPIPNVKPRGNKFNQFPQRTYTSKDYADLEKKLLNKGL